MFYVACSFYLYVVCECVFGISLFSSSCGMWHVVCLYGMVWYDMVRCRRMVCGMWYVVCLCSDLEPSVKVIVGLCVVVKSIPLEVRAQPSLFNGYIYGSFTEHSYFLFY